jgi:2-(3-amino-3-carboxypropyl)histidine synthase
MRIILQFPEGLKQEALEHAKVLEKQGHEVFVSASPTFGACDLAIAEAKEIGAERIVHFGHNEFRHADYDFDVEYVPYSIDAPLGVLEASMRYLQEYGTLGIVTTVQHVHQLDAIRSFYEKKHKRVIIGKPYGSAKLPGQILGCDVGSAAGIDSQVDAHVYFGAGRFHPLGALLATTKPFFVVDPFGNEVECIDNYRKLYRQKSRGKVMRALDAKSFAVMVSTKNGQFNMDLAKSLKSEIEAGGFDAQIVVSNTFDFESLNNMRCFDAFVNTACPRLAMDDIERLTKPLLSAGELAEVLRMKKELAAGETERNKEK